MKNTSSNWGCFLCLLLCGLSTSLTWSQSKTVQKIIDEERTDHRFYFYPSTLRMMNLNEDPSFNGMIKDIKKLIFFKFKENHFDASEMQLTLQLLINQENFEEYLSIDGAEKGSLFVVGKQDPYETVVLARQEGDYYLANLIGSIDLLQLSRLYQKISESDQKFSDGFINVFDLMSSDRKEHSDEGGQRDAEDDGTSQEEEPKKKNRT